MKKLSNKKVVTGLAFALVLLASLVLGCSTPAPAPAPAPALAPAPSPKPAPAPAPASKVSGERWVFPTMGGPVQEREITALSEALQERSEGRIPQLVPTDRKALGHKGPETWDVISTGGFEMGAVNGNYMSGQEPIMATQGLPLVYTGEQYPAVKAANDPHFAKLAEKYNLTLLATMDYPNVMWTNIELNTIADVRNLQFRTSSSTACAALGYMGAECITMSGGDIYAAMATGLINGFSFSEGSHYSYKHYEVTNYGYLSPVFNGAAVLFVINNASLSSLFAEDQKILIDTFKEWEPKLVANAHLSPELLADLKTKETVFDSVSLDLVKEMQAAGPKQAWNEWAEKYPEVTPLMDSMFGAIGVDWRN